MKQLLTTILLMSAICSYAQDKIVFKDKPDTVKCKIKSVTTSNIFYIEKGEHKSEYMRNVAYHSGPSASVVSTSTPSKPKENIVQDGNTIIKKQTTTHILIFGFRSKAPLVPDGYELYTVYTLPSTGALFVWVTPTYYVYRKK